MKVWDVVGWEMSQWDHWDVVIINNGFHETTAVNFNPTPHTQVCLAMETPV